MIKSLSQVFNFPKINWQTGLSSNEKEMYFIETLKDAYLLQHVDKPTRYREGQKSNVLDLVITREDSDILDIKYLCQFGKSDHLTLKIITNVDKQDLIENNSFRYDFKRGKIDDFRRWIKQTDWTLLEHLDVEESWQLVHSKISEGMDAFIPKVQTKLKKKSPPWMSPIVKKSI